MATSTARHRPREVPRSIRPMDRRHVAVPSAHWRRNTALGGLQRLRGGQNSLVDPDRYSATRMTTVTEQPEMIWYVSYASNMCANRLNCYLAGGTPVGALHTHSGCRDRRPPRQAAGHILAGGVYFAMESAVWGGGRAFYDPELVGAAAARAYFITSGQFADIAAQEMGRAPGKDIDLRPVLATGRVGLGPGRYETLLHVGDLDGDPLLTFTAPWHAAEVPWTVPSASYLRVLTAGLREAHSWGISRATTYLARLPGARGHWTPADIAALCGEALPTASGTHLHAG
jgi:hypothetical protein